MATPTTREFRYLRYWRNHYQCDACPNGNEFSEEMPVVCFAYCPCCDEKVEPYASEALLDYVADEEDE